MTAPDARAIGAENSSLAKMIFTRHEELKQDRNHRAPELDAVARIYRPQRTGFRASTERRDDWNLHELFNSRTLTSAGNMSASLYSTLCNPANDWFQATTPDPEAAEYHENKAWLDIVSRRMLMSFGPGMSNFYSSAVSWTADCVALGTGFIVSDEGRGRKRLIDSCISPADAVFAVDADGMADELITERWLTPVQAARFYGIDALPPKLRERAVQGKADQRTRFIQAMQPNDDFVPGRFDAKGKPFVSSHISEDGMAVVRQGGTYEQSFAIPRWDVDGSNPWGRGLGYLNLASGRKLQAQARDNLTAGALMAKPPIGTVGTKAMRDGAKIAPGQFLHGAISHTGQKLMQPIMVNNGLPITADMERQAIEEVENGWHAQLLTLVGRTGLGNLEVIEREEERLRLQAPYLGRMQSEGLTMVAERRFGLMFRAGQFPPPPRSMQGQPLEIRYTSVAALAQKASDGVATARLLQDTYALAGAQPTPEAAMEVWDNIDKDNAMAVLAEARGAPARVTRSPDDREAIRAARAQQMQIQQAMAMAEQAAGIGKDMAAMQPEQGAA
ncbi:MAG: portal protein [Pseudomonadota bacterium]